MAGPQPTPDRPLFSSHWRFNVFSQIRHTRSVAKSVSLLVASTALITAAGAQATETARTPLVLTAYSNGVGGESLLSGQYDAALTEITRYKPQLMSMASTKATNLCVAYTATKQLDAAMPACDTALKFAKYEKLSATHFTAGSSQQNAYVAIAYANRAVVHMLQHDEASAKADLERAKALAPRAAFVARNEAAVSTTRSSIAQLEIAPSR